MTLLLVIVGIAILVAVVAVVGTRQVAQGQVAIVERLGKYHRTLQPGLNVVVPGFDQQKNVQKVNRPESDVPPNRVDMREQVLDVKDQEAISKDNVLLTVDTVIFYQVTDPVRACYEIAQPVEGIIQICKTTMRSIFGEMDLDTSLSSREAVNTRLRMVLDEATDKWGIKVLRVEIQEIRPPGDLIEQMKKQMVAERDRRAQVTKAEGEKQALILEAEGVKTSRVLRAEADNQAAILLAEAEKRKRVLEAEGEAQSIRLVQEASARGLDAVRDVLGRTEGIQGLLVIEALKTQSNIARDLAAGPNSKFYLPTSLAGLYGAVDGIKEMLKFHDSMGGDTSKS